MNIGKKITIFLAAGLPKGVREVRIDQWSGKAVCGPRNALNKIITLPEIENGACIYFLIGSSDEGGLINVYVGEADGFKKRIRDHDYKKDWWQDVAVFEFFDNFDYGDESELTQAWNKYGSPVIELSDSIVTITAPQDKEHGGQHIFKSVGSATLLNNIVEIYTKRFSGHHSHMANIGYTSSVGGPIGDGDCWAALRYSPSPDGSLVVFGGNHGSVASSPIGSFNVIKIYHQEGVSYAYEPPSTKVAEYSWPMEPPSGDHVLLGGATTTYGSGKASYDWIRVRKYTSTEPSATVGSEKAVGEGTGPIYD